MVISVRLRAPCEDETGLDWPKFPARKRKFCPPINPRPLLRYCGKSELRRAKRMQRLALRGRAR